MAGFEVPTVVKTAAPFVAQLKVPFPSSDESANKGCEIVRRPQAMVRFKNCFIFLVVQFARLNLVHTLAEWK